MRQYYYMVSSLPMLEFCMKMPFSYERFVSLCKEHLSEDDNAIIINASLAPFGNIKGLSSMLREWRLFDTTLRNELAKARAGKYGKDPHRYIREDIWDPLIAGFAHWAVKQDQPFEAEIGLDKLRWEKIDDLQRGHYFDTDYLTAYALKLQILERWDKIKSTSGMQALEELMMKGLE